MSSNADFNSKMKMTNAKLSNYISKNSNPVSSTSIVSGKYISNITKSEAPMTRINLNSNSLGKQLSKAPSNPVTNNNSNNVSLVGGSSTPLYTQGSAVQSTQPASQAFEKSYIKPQIKINQPSGNPSFQHIDTTKNFFNKDSKFVGGKPSVNKVDETSQPGSMNLNHTIKNGKSEIKIQSEILNNVMQVKSSGLAQQIPIQSLKSSSILQASALHAKTKSMPSNKPASNQIISQVNKIIQCTPGQIPVSSAVFRKPDTAVNKSNVAFQNSKQGSVVSSPTQLKERMTKSHDKINNVDLAGSTHIEIQTEYEIDELAYTKKRQIELQEKLSGPISANNNKITQFSQNYSERPASSVYSCRNEPQISSMFKKQQGIIPVLNEKGIFNPNPTGFSTRNPSDPNMRSNLENSKMLHSHSNLTSNNFKKTMNKTSNNADSNEFTSSFKESKSVGKIRSDSHNNSNMEQTYSGKPMLDLRAFEFTKQDINRNFTQVNTKNTDILMDQPLRINQNFKIPDTSVYHIASEVDFKDDIEERNNGDYPYAFTEQKLVTEPQSNICVTHEKESDFSKLLEKQFDKLGPEMTHFFHLKLVKMFMQNLEQIEK